MKNPFEVFRQKDFKKFQKRQNVLQLSFTNKTSNQEKEKDSQRIIPYTQRINKSSIDYQRMSQRQRQLHDYIKQTEQYLWKSNKRAFYKRPRYFQELSTDISLRNRDYEFTNEQAKSLSKKGCGKYQKRYTIKECKQQMVKQLKSLNTDYKYNFYHEESPSVIEKKKMTRTIYLSFRCNSSHQNAWTTISGTFQITFQYQRVNKYFLFDYHIRIFRTKCCKCLKYMQPLVYQTQMEAMKIFFSVIIVSIVGEKQPPKKPQKYYIKPNHWHKAQWCQACQLNRCTTQNHIH